MGIENLNPYVLLAKIGGVLLAAAVIAGVAYTKGMERTQERWDAAVTEQQLKTGEFIIKQAHNSAQADQRHQAQVQALEQRTRLLTQKVRDYEHGTSQKCELSPEFESVADGFIRVREPSADRLPASTDPAGLADGAVRSGLADVAVLRAFEDVTTKVYACADQLNALIEWERTAQHIATEGAGR